MPGLLQFKLSVLDEISPKLTELSAKSDRLTAKLEKPHSINVNTTPAEGGLGKLAGLAGRAFAAFGVFEAVTGIAKLGMDMEQTRAQFEVFTGSAEKGNDAIARLQKFAQITPFDDAEVIASGRNLLAAGFAVDELQGKLSILGNVSAGAKKPLQELVSIYTKNKGSGLIQGEDLNQLSEAGIPMAEFAKVLGVTEDKVRKLGSEGKISFAVFDKVLENLGGKTGKWGNLMDKQSQTVAGRLSSLVGLAQNLGGKLGEMLNPFLGKMVDAGFKLLDLTQKAPAFFEEYKTGLLALGITVAALSAETLILSGIQKAQALYTTISTAAQWALNAAMTANPIGLVVAGVALLVGGLAVLYQKTEGVRGAIDGMVAGAKSAFMDLASAGLKILGGLGRLMRGIFTLDKNEIAKGLQEAAAGLNDGAPGRIMQKAGKLAGEAYKKGVLSVRAEKAAKNSAAGTDAATDFLSKGGKPGASALAPGLATAKDAGAAGANGGSKVTNITLRVQQLVGEVKIQAATVSEGADQMADIVLKKLMAQLNDVNTIASN